jgi:hypothetical protein
VSSSKPTRVQRLLARIQNHRLLSVVIAAGILVTAVLTFANTLIDFANKVTLDKRPETSEFRARYFTIRGHALPYLLSGELDPLLRRTFRNKDAIVIKNEVYAALALLQKRYATTIHGYKHVEISGESGFDEGNVDDSPVLAMSSGQPRMLSGLNFTSILAARPDLAIGEDSAWRVHLEDAYESDDGRSDLVNALRAGALPGDVAGLVRPISCDDALAIMRIALHPHGDSDGQSRSEEDAVAGESEPQQGTDETIQRLYNFYRSMQNSSCPYGFFQLEVGDVGCGGVAALRVRTLSLRAMIIENTSSTPVSAGEFRVVSYSGPGIRESLRTDQSSQREVSYFPAKTLLPQEVLIVPMYLFFEPDELVGPSEISDEEVLGALGTRPSVYIERLESIPISRNMLLARVRAEPGDTKGNRFFLGDAIEPKDALINERWHGLHSEDGGYIAISDYTDEGSCPFLFVDYGDGRWMQEGTVLTNRDGVSARGKTIKRLKRFPHRIKIEENEDETSLIESVYLRQRCPGSDPRTVYPREASELFRDGATIALRRGDAAEMSFEDSYSGSLACDQILIVNGYFTLSHLGR